jgi:hypothetical protein
MHLLDLRFFQPEILCLSGVAVLDAAVIFDAIFIAPLADEIDI